MSADRQVEAIKTFFGKRLVRVTLEEYVVSLVLKTAAEQDFWFHALQEGSASHMQGNSTSRRFESHFKPWSKASNPIHQHAHDNAYPPSIAGDNDSKIKTRSDDTTSEALFMRLLSSSQPSSQSSMNPTPAISTKPMTPPTDCYAGSGFDLKQRQMHNVHLKRHATDV